MISFIIKKYEHSLISKGLLVYFHILLYVSVERNTTSSIILIFGCICCGEPEINEEYPIICDELDDYKYIVCYARVGVRDSDVKACQKNKKQ